MQQDEVLDIVNENDEVIGTKTRSEIYKESLKNFRVINAFIVNSERKLWIPRRTAHKRYTPLCLDMSLGGHVEIGESYEGAFKRELQEELNLNADNVPYHLLGYLTPQKDAVNAFMNVYEIKMDMTPDYNKDDFIEAFWLTPRELYDKLAKGDKSKADLPILVKKFYA